MRFLLHYAKKGYCCNSPIKLYFTDTLTSWFVIFFYTALRSYRYLWTEEALKLLSPKRHADCIHKPSGLFVFIKTIPWSPNINWWLSYIWSLQKHGLFPIYVPLGWREGGYSHTKTAPPVWLLHLLNGKSLEFSHVRRISRLRKRVKVNKHLMNNFSSTVRHKRCRLHAILKHFSQMSMEVLYGCKSALFTECFRLLYMFGKVITVLFPNMVMHCLDFFISMMVVLNSPLCFIFNKVMILVFSSLKLLQSQKVSQFPWYIILSLTPTPYCFMKIPPKKLKKI